ncbi:MAG: hypothetical protein U0Y08_11880 [Bacteroidia bacterium]
MNKKSLLPLLKSLPATDDERTYELYKQFRHLKKQGYLTKKELLDILRWKSPRPLKQYESNEEKMVREITKLAFAAKNDVLKLHILTALNGVNYPAASSILMFYDPKKYPVLDIRVWKQLYAAKLVNINPRGQNFSLKQCGEFLTVIRKLARELNLTARQVEKRLFDFDRSTQRGRLYE